MADVILGLGFPSKNPILAGANLRTVSFREGN